MKTHRKAKAVRKAARRRSAPLSLSARVERLEKQLLFKPPAAAVATAIANARFVNLGADGKPTTGDHVAVLDTTTGLTWSAAPLADGKRMNHGDAMKACAACDLLGHKDWRAPTVQELLSIVDYERYDPAVDTAHFKGDFGWTWSSTPYKGNSGAAWFVYLYLGLSDWSFRNYELHARAVRAGQQLGLTE